MDRRTPIAITLACLLSAPLAAGAAPADDLPSPEQIDAVTGTQPMPALEGEAPAQLDVVSVEASRRREVAYRTIAVALERPRSDRADAADTVVCQKKARVGTHITKIYCASNRTWNYVRKVTMRDTLGDMASTSAGYTLYEGPVYELSPTVLNSIGKQYADGDHAARLAQLTAEESVQKIGDEWDTPATVVARFARAFDAVGRIAKQGGDDAQVEQQMAAAIAAQGFSIDEYNDLVARLESSGRFQQRVSMAVQSFR